MNHDSFDDYLHAGINGTPQPATDEEPPPPGDDDAPEEAAPEPKKKKGPSIADQLIHIALAQCELLRDRDGATYAAHGRATWPVNSTTFRRWLAAEYYGSRRRGASPSAIQQAILTIDAEAASGEETKIGRRVAGAGDSVYLDLADEDNTVIEIDAQGWRVADRPPVRFVRMPGMRPLPMPRPGELVTLRSFINVTDEEWPLVAGWLVGAMRPKGPYAILFVHGEHGAAKTTLCRVLRLTVDPNVALTRAPPREERDLMIAARNGLIVALENVSHLNADMSDALCRLSTGGGLATRTLYTNDEETVIDAMRPVLINGISEVATRGDLSDRGLFITLQKLARVEEEGKFWPRFHAALPGIIGGLLTATSTALGSTGTIAGQVPRMADFATWVCRAEPALGCEPGGFLAAYRQNRAEAAEVTLDASVLAPTLRRLAGQEGLLGESGWCGTAKELLGEAESDVPVERRRRGWPKSARAVSGHVRRLAPTLRECGVDVEFLRAHGARKIALRGCR